MAVLPLLCGALMLGSIAADTKTYTNRVLEMSFSYPSTWTLETDRNNNAFFRPPVARGTALIEIRPIVFRQAADKWQEIQVQMAEQLRREVVRQWQEELLGVPLLLTEYRYPINNEPHASVTGLLYTKSLNKMQFRLIAPAVAFEEVEREWRQVLQTLRPTTGSLPPAEQPGEPLPERKPEETTPEVQPFRRLPSPDELRPVVKGAVSVDARAAGQQVRLLLPREWTAEPAGEAFAVRHPRLTTPITIAVYGTLDSPAPQKALLAAVNAGLSEFSQVTRRLEPPSRRNRAGATVWSVRRSGQGASGPLETWHAVGLTGEYYWFATFRSGSAAIPPAEAKLIEGLLDGTSVVPSS